MLTHLRSGVGADRGTVGPYQEKKPGDNPASFVSPNRGLLGLLESLEALIDHPLLVVLRGGRALLDALVRLLQLLVDDRDKVVDRHRAGDEATVDEERRGGAHAELLE